MPEAQTNRNLARFTSLRAGGDADRLVLVRTADELAETALTCQLGGEPLTVIGHGSNVLPSDDGVEGTVAVNLAQTLSISPDGEVEADAGLGYQELFLKTAQAGLDGFQYAVGIPGTIGGALASNAGAYRNQIGDVVTAVEVVQGGRRRWEDPSFLQLSYRDSILRKPEGRNIVVTRLRFKLVPGDPHKTYSEARLFQQQRILKQPPSCSAGSFFKNVTNTELARSLARLPEQMKAVGVVPAGFLLEDAGVGGMRLGGAMFSQRHANFLMNVGGATASDLRNLATEAKARVLEKFGVLLEEEVLYLGRWKGWS